MKMLSNRTGGFLPALILAVMLVLGLPAQKAQAQDYYDDYGNGDYQEFYDDLSPYGQWLNDPQYGYVWAPNAGGDFRPYYTNGRWVMTEYGNTWVSDYSWGWAPFHYGRWAQSSYYGWIWIPGNEWGPAWVNWRQGGGYYGWAPMGPGISINISFGYNVPNPWWTFIPCGNIYTPGWQRYYSPRRTVNIINNTTIINNTYVDNRTRNTYVSGPRRTEIEAVTRQRVNVYNISNRTRAGATNINGRTVQVYRPSIQRTSGRAQVNVAPRQAKTLERSVITNTGGGRAPSRPAATQQQNSRIDRSTQMREASRNQQSSKSEMQQRVQREQQQPARQREVQMQREQQVQQQRMQREQQQQRVQQAEQQRNVQMQREQQMQQQRMQRDQQQQRVQQAEQQRNVQMQREQQMQEQRMQQQQRNMQREQQMQQRQQMQQQRNVERAQPQPQRIERSAPAPQQQRMERRAEPQQRNVERSPRDR